MKSPTIAGVVVALSLCTLASLAVAQTAPLLTPGTRLRLTMMDSSRPVRIARFEALTDSTLVVSGDPSARVIPLTTIQRLESSRGRKPSVLGGAVGLIVGVAAGGAAACAANRDSYGVFCAGQNDTKVGVGAAVGGIAGAALGAFLFRRDRWSPLGLPLRNR